MRLRVEPSLDYQMPEPADVLLAIEAAPTEEQRLLVDKLIVNSAEPLRTVPGDDRIGRRTWVHVAVGRDATDISFMAIFGRADFLSQSASVTRLD